MVLYLIYDSKILDYLMLIPVVLPVIWEDFFATGILGGPPYGSWGGI